MKNKPFASLPAVQLYGSSIGLPDSEIAKFYDYYESNGWCVGRVKMRSYEAALRNWKRNYDARNGHAVAVLRMPAWKQVENYEKAIAVHPANPHWVGYRKELVTEPQREDLKRLRTLLKQQQVNAL